MATVRARTGSGVAPTLGAPVQHFPTTAASPQPKLIVAVAGVDQDVHLHGPSIAACTALAYAFSWRGKPSVAASRTSLEAD